MTATLNFQGAIISKIKGLKWWDQGCLGMFLSSLLSSWLSKSSDNPHCWLPNQTGVFMNIRFLATISTTWIILPNFYRAHILTFYACMSPSTSANSKNVYIQRKLCLYQVWILTVQKKDALLRIFFSHFFSGNREFQSRLTITATWFENVCSRILEFFCFF